LVLAQCSGSGTSREYDPSCEYNSVDRVYYCINPYIEVTTYCSGSSEPLCYRQGDFWENECMSANASGCTWSGLSRSSNTIAGCTWTQPCSCSYTSWSDCYTGGGGICLRNQTNCSCTPSGCGSCGTASWQL